MIKVKIVLDEEKILKERKYDLTKIWNVINNAFNSKNINIEDKGMYAGTNHPDDFANFGLICIDLGHEDWFLDNVIEWKFYNSDSSGNEEEFNEEDLLQDSEYYKVGFRW